ncbi:glutathione S-transferase family protein [Paracoccus simplex]|uniref:Glutathione S-transferase family protein n=1 Tax=Paracoccus simplex TaxID=2086346 RepID=A0ABV7S3J6_9RHOB
MTPTITAFANSPDRGQGQARDMRVRWALEEIGQPYDVRLVSFGEMKQPPHLTLHPFGQIPTYEEGNLALFESGAIVLHVAQRHPGLLPEDANARARAIMWIFAALIQRVGQGDRGNVVVEPQLVHEQPSLRLVMFDHLSSDLVQVITDRRA